MRWRAFRETSIKKISYVSPQGSYSLAARARLQAPHGAREPTARVACSGEAVQGCAKANANRIELVELENVIGDHPREGLTEGPVSAQPSDRASASRRMVVLGVTKLGGLLRVPGESASLHPSKAQILSHASLCYYEGQVGPWSSPAVF